MTLLRLHVTLMALFLLRNARVYTTAAVVGLDGQLIEVQVDLAQQGLPLFFLVGLPNAVVKEARERVRTAIKNSGLIYPLRRIIANLARAELPNKIRLMIFRWPWRSWSPLASSIQLDPPPPISLFVGELSLDGQVRHVQGVLPIVAGGRCGPRHP